MIARDTPLRLAPLAAADAADVWRLFGQVRARVPHGHLAPKQAEDIATLLAGPQGAASVGVWQGDRLVGYSLCRLQAAPPDWGGGVLRRLAETGASVWVGQGTVIDPSCEGLLLMPRLLALRGELIRQSGGGHSLGLIATDNLPSLAGALRAGARLVGLHHDADCLNFVCYAGGLTATLYTTEIECDATDTDTLAALLADGWVGHALCRGNAHRRILRLRRWTGVPVTVARGTRDYIHSIDMLHGAPISVTDTGFRFRFHRVAHVACQWRPATAGEDRAAFMAELTLQRGAQTEAWVFVPEAPVRELTQSPEAHFAAEPGQIRHEGSRLTLPLFDTADFWEQLVEAVRHGGQILFPGRKWLTIEISASGHCLAPVPVGATLRLELVGTRRQVNVIRFVRSDGGEGRILTIPRPGNG